jgi:NAD(P)-dependent dehydrogenase (short-subunit alcohol dehydrogenase family)
MKSALITGGTRGIGLGIARALAREGWTLALGGQRAEPEAASALSEVRALGVEVHYLRGDLSSTEDRGRMLAALRAAIGVPNALVNNAGRAPRARLDLLEATEDSFDEVLRTNLQGPYFLTQAIARDQIERHRAIQLPARSLRHVGLG